MHAQAYACHKDPALCYEIRISLRTKVSNIFTVLVVVRSRRRSLARVVRTYGSSYSNLARYPSTVGRSSTYCNFKVCLGSVENDARSKSPTSSTESLVRGTHVFYSSISEIGRPE